MGLLDQLLGGGLKPTPGIAPGTVASTPGALGGPSTAPPAAPPSGLMALLSSPQIAAAASLLESSGPQIGAGVGTGQALGRALTSATQASNSNQQQALQQRLVQQSLEKAKREERIKMAKEFTPESIKAFEAGEGDLVPRAGKEGPLTAPGKIAVDIQNGFITPETGEALMKAGKSGTNVDVFNAEAKLRTEANKFTEGPRKALASLANSKNLLNEGNAIAVRGAMTSFIQSIDNSVVRPAEEAAYSEARGIAAYWEDQLSRASGQGLTEETKAELSAAIDAMGQSAKDILARSEDYYSRIAVSHNLNPEFVSGAPVAQARAAPAAAQAARALAPPTANDTVDDSTPPVQL